MTVLKKNFNLLHKIIRFSDIMQHNLNRDCTVIPKKGGNFFSNFVVFSQHLNFKTCTLPLFQKSFREIPVYENVNYNPKKDLTLLWMGALEACLRFCSKMPLLFWPQRDATGSLLGFMTSTGPLGDNAKSQKKYTHFLRASYNSGCCCLFTHITLIDTVAAPLRAALG